MSDKIPKLSRRKALLGLGGIGAGATLGGAGTMAFLNDREKIADNTVRAGELDLKLDWVSFYYGKRLYTDYQPPANDPGPMFTINDAKPGDFGGGCISLHVKDNPALIWANCKLEEWENGRKDPEDKVDHDNYGELAENIHIALLKFPITYSHDNVEAEANKVKARLQNNGDMSEAEVKSIQPNCHLLYFTTLKDFCDHENNNTSNNSDHHYGHLLDPYPLDPRKKCFSPRKTYWYCFLWWIPYHVGNEIQSDSAKFDLTFWAEQCRHNPRANNGGPMPADSNSD